MLYSMDPHLDNGGSESSATGYVDGFVDFVVFEDPFEQHEQSVLG